MFVCKIVTSSSRMIIIIVVFGYINISKRIKLDFIVFVLYLHFIFIFLLLNRKL